MGEVGAVPEGGDDALLDLVPVVRRVVAARIRDPHLVEDLVQETLARMAANRTRLDPEALVPYAIVTARNLIASHVQRTDLERRKAHLVADAVPPPSPEDEALVEERRRSSRRRWAGCRQRERELLVAHEVARHRHRHAGGRPELHRRVRSRPSSTGAGRSCGWRYLLAQERREPPTDRCRPVLIALSGGERRRQRELDAAGHLLECEFCAALGPALLDRRSSSPDDEVRVPVTRDADVVTARLKGREIAAQGGLLPAPTPP